VDDFRRHGVAAETRAGEARGPVEVPQRRLGGNRNRAAGPSA